MEDEMIYNFPKIKKLLKFENEGDFYYLQIIQRKKENPEISKSEKVVKNYYIENLDYLNRKQDEIIKLCDNFNARAYIRLNKRNYKDLTYRANELLAKYMTSGQYRATMSIWDKVCGRYHAEDEKKWIIDFDEYDTDADKISIGKTLHLMNQCQPIRADDITKNNHIITVLNSKSGIHAITRPFNKKEFKDRTSDKRQYAKFEIHVDNPTNLYIP